MKYVLCCLSLLLNLNLNAFSFDIYKLTVKYTSASGMEKQIDFNFSDKFNNEDLKAEYNFDKTIGRYVLKIRALNPFMLKTAVLDAKYEGDNSTKYFCNGFQSWTTSKEYRPNEKIKRLSPLLNAYSKNAGDYYLYKHSRKKGNLHSWSWTYWRNAEKFRVLTSLSEAVGFTVFRFDTEKTILRIEKDCEGFKLEADKSLEIFDILYREVNGYGNYSQFMQEYSDLYFSKYSLPRKADASTAFGWTSWYYHYAEIDEKIIEKNLNAFAENNLPIDIFQIDDGYQKEVGDWLITNSKFPSGMKNLADKIHNKGFKAGIWLAPFIASEKSEVYKNHPDWFIRKANGKHLMVARNVIWKGPYYALDIYHPEARDYIKKVLHTILREWDYDLIKVDFLFAACLQPRPDKTRGRIMYDAMRFLHEAAGDDKQILGCGVPLASAFGMVDYCRIGNDAHTGWELKSLKWLNAHERPSTWSTMTNSINRAVLNGRFFQNDPDVYLLRNKKCTLSETQKKTMFLVNNLFGEVLFTSDDIDEYDTLQLQYYRSAFPLNKRKITEIDMDVKDAYVVEFKIENRKYVVYINLSNKSVVLKRPAEHKSYYDGESKQLIDVGNTKGLPLLPYESKCYYMTDKKHEDMEKHLFNDNWK